MQPFEQTSSSISSVAVVVEAVAELGLGLAGGLAARGRAAGRRRSSAGRGDAASGGPTVVAARAGCRRLSTRGHVGRATAAAGHAAGRAAGRAARAGWRIPGSPPEGSPGSTLALPPLGGTGMGPRRRRAWVCPGLDGTGTAAAGSRAAPTRAAGQRRGAIKQIRVGFRRARSSGARSARRTEPRRRAAAHESRKTCSQILIPARSRFNRHSHRSADRSGTYFSNALFDSRSPASTRSHTQIEGHGA